MHNDGQAFFAKISADVAKTRCGWSATPTANAGRRIERLRNGHKRHGILVKQSPPL
jgi:hypothetical protein